MKHPHLFEITTWPWLERLSGRENRLVTLADVPPHEWDAVAARGFDFVFLMGVWQRSPLGRDLALADDGLRAEYDRALPGWDETDVVGSPYCIRSYEPDARMGGWQGLDTARAELRRRGIGLILDFVPNHTAFDHPWTTSHPDWYVQGTPLDAADAPLDFRRVGDAIIACARDPYFPPWRDVAQLNYLNPDTRAAMTRELRAIRQHCDGVRCDMAMLVINDVFERTWGRLIRERWQRPMEEFWPMALREVPELVSIAEVYWDLEWTLQQQGFQYTYDKRLLDRLRGSAAADVRGHLRADPAFSERLVRFLENHDEPRSAAALADRLTASAALFGTLPGMRFYFDGQLEGRRIRTPVQLARWAEERIDWDVAAMYERLLATTSAANGPLFHEGEWKLLEVTSADDDGAEDLIAFRWRTAQALALIVSNPGSAIASGHVPVVADLPKEDAFDFADALTGVTYRRKRKALDVRGLYVRLPPGGAHLFMVRCTKPRPRHASE